MPKSKATPAPTATLEVLTGDEPQSEALADHIGAEIAPPENPAWEDARAILEEWHDVGRRAAMTYVRLGLTLDAIKERDYSANGTNQFGEKTAAPAESPAFLKRWTEDCETHLGLNRRTADRYIADARRYIDLRRVAAGEPVETRAGRPINPDEETRRTAEQLLLDIEANQIRPARAWAGFTGGRTSGGQGRAHADSLELVYQSLGTLRRHIGKWDDFPARDQAKLKKQWLDLLAKLPEDLDPGT